MSRVLITGGAGFIGFHLAKKFIANDYKVDIIDGIDICKIDQEFSDFLKNNKDKVAFHNIDILSSNFGGFVDKSYIFTEKTINETYNLGIENGEIQNIELVKKISNMCNKQIRYIETKKNVNSQPRRCPDMSKLLEVVNYRYQYQLEQGLEQYYKWFLNIEHERK